MTGAEPHDRDHAADTDRAGRADHAGRSDRLRYRDPLGLVSEGRPLSRPMGGSMARIVAVAAVCGAGLLAGLGLFGGSAAKPARPVPATGIVKAADTLGTRSETHSPLTHRPRAHHPAKRPQHPAHISPSHPGAHGAQKTSTHKDSTQTGAAHKGSAGTGAPLGTVRHSRLKGSGQVRPSAPHPATARPAEPAATPRTAPPHSSPATGPAASR